MLTSGSQEFMKQRAKENKKDRKESVSGKDKKISDGKKPDDKINDEFPLVHIISDEDTEKHLGISETESKHE